jgi:hypothetical protein
MESLASHTGAGGGSTGSSSVPPPRFGAGTAGSLLSLIALEQPSLSDLQAEKVRAKARRHKRKGKGKRQALKLRKAARQLKKLRKKLAAERKRRLRQLRRLKRSRRLERKAAKAGGGSAPKKCASKVNRPPLWVADVTDPQSLLVQKQATKDPKLNKQDLKLVQSQKPGKALAVGTILLYVLAGVTNQVATSGGTGLDAWGHCHRPELEGLGQACTEAEGLLRSQHQH